MRRPLIVGNWKMNGDRARVWAWCAEVMRGIGDGGIDIALCPPHILIPAAVTALANSQVVVGAQDVDANADGAFTGQVSAGMLVDGGCRCVIVGHSERRALYFETDEVVARKAATALSAGLGVIMCVGESEAERDIGDAETVVARQVQALCDGLASVSASASDGGGANNIVIAYEPVWAIGSGQTATPEQAQAMHRFIREQIAGTVAGRADCRIVYGGSMKPDNAAELLAEPDIDGGLIGGASLNAADFAAICKTAAGLT